MKTLINLLAYLKPSPVLKHYLDAKLSNPLIKEGESLIQGLPTHDKFIKQAQEAQKGIPFPEKHLKKEAKQKVLKIIKTPLPQLPKGTKKVAFTHEGVEGYLIGTPVGDKHQRVQWVTKEGDILHEVVMANEDFPNVLVVDFFKKDEECETFKVWRIPHGTLVKKFVERFNPFLNIEEVESHHTLKPNVWRDLLNRLDAGERINIITCSVAQGSAICEENTPEEFLRKSTITLIEKRNLFTTELTEKRKSLKRLLPLSYNREKRREFLDKELELLPYSKGVSQKRTTSAHGIVERVNELISALKSSIVQLKRAISALDLALSCIKYLPQVSRHGKSPLMTKKQVSFYKSSGNQGDFESNGKYVVSYNVACVDGHIVGGTQADGSLHPQVSGAIFVNKTAPYSYEVTPSEEGINITGGNPLKDPVDITREELGKMNDKEYEEYLKRLPKEISGTSFACPTRLAKDWLDEIIKAVKRNEGKLPNQVSKELQKNMKTLGIVVPKQGPPSY